MQVAVVLPLDEIDEILIRLVDCVFFCCEDNQAVSCAEMRAKRRFTMALCTLVVEDAVDDIAFVCSRNLC